MRPSRLLLPAVLAVGALALSGCVNNEATTPGSGGSSAAAVKVDKAAAALLPKDIASAGVLKFGTDAAYPPNEYKDPSGTPVGWEIELTNAMAAKLGLTPRYSIAKFDNILPSIIGGKYDVGISSFFDTKERQQKADMVDYYKVGTQWAAPAGKTVDPNSACGLKVAVQNGTTEALNDVPAKSKACTDAGKAEIQILGYDQQDDATSAVTLGRADAVAADSPVLQYAVKKSGGKLALAGDAYDVFFYGMPVQKNRGTLAKALQTALQDLRGDGTYTSILKKWGVEAGAIDTMNINGAAE
jgi:polar amino acid transport system substrate-binding protein